MIATVRDLSATGHRKKATFLLPEKLLDAVDSAVAGGAAASKNAFVEQAIAKAIAEVNRQQRRARLQAARHDPLFQHDVEEIERDFPFIDGETVRGIV